MQKIVCILGQTATGKSDLAVEIAKKYNGEIISADSRQTYKWLDIGSGKIKKGEMKGVKHYLLDVADPRYKRYTAADFAAAAKSAANDIFSRGKLPIICGGTGFYIESFLHENNFPPVLPNKKLRAKLSKLSAEALMKELRRLDSVRAKNIDPKNKVRIIRAIEIAKSLGHVPPQRFNLCKYKILSIGLTLPSDKLKEKIHARLMKRMRGDALIKEIKNLHKRGVSWQRLYDFGLEYRYVSIYLKSRARSNLPDSRFDLTRKEMLNELEKEIYRFAKRQMTWFHRDKNIKWFFPSEKSKIEKEVKKFLTSPALPTGQAGGEAGNKKDIPGGTSLKK